LFLLESCWMYYVTNLKCFVIMGDNWAHMVGGLLNNMTIKIKYFLFSFFKYMFLRSKTLNMTSTRFYLDKLRLKTCAFTLAWKISHWKWDKEPRYWRLPSPKQTTCRLKIHTSMNSKFETNHMWTLKLNVKVVENFHA